MGRAPRALADKLRVLERGNDMVLAAHFTPLGGRLGLVAQTVETVRFTRPERVDFRLVRGPVPHVVEAFVLTEQAGGAGTRLAYDGEIGADLWLLGQRWCALVARRWEQTVAASLAAVKAEAERRASSVGGTPALPPRPSAPNHRLTAGAADRIRRNLGEVAIGCRFGPGLFVEEVSEPHPGQGGHMAKYLILIYGQESDAAPTPDQWDWMMKAHGQFAQAVDQQGGKILGGEALRPTATATSVRNDGQAVTDGPFVETKEALGGFYLIEAADLDQALAFAKLCPAPGGGVELRPIMDTSGAPPSA